MISNYVLTNGIYLALEYLFRNSVNDFFGSFYKAKVGEFERAQGRGMDDILNCDHLKSHTESIKLLIDTIALLNLFLNLTNYNYGVVDHW